MNLNSYYDFEVFVKSIRIPNSPTNYIEIIVGYIDINHYYILRADISNQNWLLLHINDEGINSTPIKLYSQID